jgi:hypothetical protein
MGLGEATCVYAVFMPTSFRIHICVSDRVFFDSRCDHRNHPESIASGAILAMLADSMMPEAYEDGGSLIGFSTMLGFLTAFILSKI